MGQVNGLIYLYCVTGDRPRSSISPDAGDEVYTIGSAGAYAVVRRVSDDEFGEENLRRNLADMQWVERKVREHEKVIEGVMKEATVLPFKFCTVFQTEGRVLELLDDGKASFAKMVDLLEGKEEWAVKMYCDFDQLKNVVAARDETIKKLGEEIPLSPAGRAYLLKRKREELVKRALDDAALGLAHDSFNELKRFSSGCKIVKTLPKEATGRKDDMVLNVAFLVSRERITEFDNALAQLNQEYSDRGLSVECTGPWPPYNFCALEAKHGDSGG